MHRFFNQELGSVGEQVELPGAAARQCSRVLRMRPPDKLALFDGSGQEVVVRLTEVSQEGVMGLVETCSFPSREAHRRVELAVVMPRQEKWEWILQKAVELGVAHFQPLESARSVMRLSDGDWKKKVGRWEKIILEAVEQSGRTRIPSLAAPIPLRSLLPGEGIVLHTVPGLPGLHRVVLEHYAANLDQPVRILVGPEGGLEEAEFDWLCEAGWRGAALGPRTLRCETAAITACALALDALGCMGEMGNG